MPHSHIPAWHKVVEAKDPNALDKLLAPECIFYSPIVFAPQKGRSLTKMYLTAAMKVFNEAGNFHYVKEVEQGNAAVLEFNATIDGVLIDGIDMITWNDRGLITEFKVMLRPFRAIEKMGEKMKAELESQSTFQKLKVAAGSILDKLS
jgi:ketosteroid isomerase-like protein